MFESENGSQVKDDGAVHLILLFDFCSVNVNDFEWNFEGLDKANNDR